VLNSRQIAVTLVSILSILSFFNSPANAADMNGCWVRDYDSTHLAQHRTQRIKRVTLRLSPMRDSEPWTTSAEVASQIRTGPGWWVAGGDCTTSGAGLSCTIDDDGGRFDVRLDGQQLRMEVVDDLRLVRSQDAVGDGPEVHLRSNDPENRIYLLNRSKLSQCR
jgi:hypothetical protein